MSGIFTRAPLFFRKSLPNPTSNFRIALVAFASIKKGMAPKKDVKKEEKLLFGRPSNNLKVGIVGLPNVGKSTFFNAITNSSARAENFPFCTIDPEEARVAVPDARFDWLCELYKPVSRVPAYLTVIDIAGLVKGASSGAGLGNAFLSHIESVDAIFHLVRGFSGDEVVHVEGDVNPIRDLEIISEELRLKDEKTLTKVIEGSKRLLRGQEGNKEKMFEHNTLVKALEMLTNDKKDIRHGEWTNKEIEILNPHRLLTAKSVIYLCNVSEEDFLRKKNKFLPKIKAWIDEKSPGEMLIPFSGGLECKASEGRNFEEKQQIIREVAKAHGLDEGQVNSAASVLPKIIVNGYSNLQLINYFTSGHDEVRAWTVRNGIKAPAAAGVIHSDMERGFIMADVMKFEDLKSFGNENAAKAAGKSLQKGKDYVVEDGDIMYFKFNPSGGGKKK